MVTKNVPPVHSGNSSKPLEASSPSSFLVDGSACEGVWITSVFRPRYAAALTAECKIAVAAE